MVNIKNYKEDCKNCKYLYVTYDKYYPWGCRAFGFKSKKYPYNEVYSISGMKCALFKVKDKTGNKIRKKGRFA
tara:strand:- start:451 stop:669 length:219 start_codon:yes stop_codon:yes gene_type:complete